MFELKRSQIVQLVYILSICVCSAKLENQSFVDEQLATRSDQPIADGPVSDQVKGHVKDHVEDHVEDHVKVNNQQNSYLNQFSDVDRPMTSQDSLENETDNQVQINKNPQTNSDQPTDELGSADSLNDYVFSENVRLNKLILENNGLSVGHHSLISDNYGPPDGYYQDDLQSFQQQVQQNRSKVYLFAPKQILDTSASSQDDADQLRESHLSLPTKSTLSKSFPQLYKQLYKLEKSPLQRDLQQFFRATVDLPPTGSPFTAADRPFNAKGIEANAQVSTQTVQNLPLAEADPYDGRSVQTDFARLSTAGTFGAEQSQSYGRDHRKLIDETDRYERQFTRGYQRDPYGDPNDGDKYYGVNDEDSRRIVGRGNATNAINTESSNKNESLVKSDLLTRNENQTAIQIEYLKKRGKKLTYKEGRNFLKYISPLEFKVMKMDKSKFNTKRYVPKIIYSNQRGKSKKKRNKNVDAADDQNIGRNTGQNEPDGQNKSNGNSDNYLNENNPNDQTLTSNNDLTNNPNNLKLIPVSYLLDANGMLNGNLVGVSPLNGYQTAPESALYPDSLSLLYNLNSFDLIGTLIGSLISNLPNLPNGVPNNMLDFSLDLPRNLPDLINEALLVGVNRDGGRDESSRRLEKRVRSRKGKNDKKSNKRQIEEMKRSAQMRQLLNAIQVKELAELLLLNSNADQTNGEPAGEQTKGQLIELLKKNAKVNSVLSGLRQLYPNSDFDLSKLDLSKLDLGKLKKLLSKVNKDSAMERDARKDQRAHENADQPKCFELNNSTICFSNIDGMDG